MSNIKTIKIKVSKEESESVERLFYETNTLKGLIEYFILSKYDNELINEQIKNYVEKTVELERLKDKLSRKYAPEELETYLDYVFNFYDEAIEYHEQNK